MHLTPDKVLARATRYLVEKLQPAQVRHVLPAEIQWWPVTNGGSAVGQGEPVPRAEAMAAAYEPFEPGMMWGPAWGTAWFHITAEVPEDIRGLQTELHVDLGFNEVRPGFQCEGLAIDAEGHTIKGIHPLNRYVPIDGDRVDIYLEAAANPDVIFKNPPYAPTTLGAKDTAGPEPLYRFGGAWISVREPEVVALVTEVAALVELAPELPADSPRKWEICAALDAALDQIDTVDVVGTATQARELLAPVLAKPASPSALQLTALGHSHIDTVWLWPERETRRKVVRTLSNAVALAETEDDHIFTVSAAQHLAWLKEDDPETFDRLRAQVKAGRIVPVGGTWIEPDANLPGGEALSRHLSMGIRFFRDEVGHRCRELWLPDSFGYSGALPQLARLAGMRWFLTQKISWNEVNEFPHHTLRWEGIDGSRLFTHFPSADTYCASLTGAELAHAERNFKDKGRATKSMIPFGFGDGGGGPTREMLEKKRVVTDLEGSPRIVVETPEEFFEGAEREYPDAPVWVGELYLEKHRGAATSLTEIKAGNRRNERLLQEAELWSATAALRAGFDYPYEDLEECWRRVLVLQFHDILPGTSVEMANREVVVEHAELTARLEGLVDAALTDLGLPSGEGVVVNSAPVTRGAIAAQSAAAATSAKTPARLFGQVLENDVVRAKLDANGLLVSLVDLTSGRETIPPGTAAGLLQLHHDFPAAWDAWDVDESVRRNPIDIPEVSSMNLRADDDGTVLAEFGRQFGHSSAAIQRWVLGPGSAPLRLEIGVDWQEQDKILKVSFPVDVHTETADFEIAFGHLRRPIHENTSWDAARFEVSAHRWLHLGEPGWGVAIANERTYGWDVSRHPRDGGGTFAEARASLVKGSRYPDPRADRGEHSYSFLLEPGADLAAARRLGYAATIPVRERGGSPVEPLVTVSGSAVVETVKLADDRSGDLVVRVFEPLGARGESRLQFNVPVSSVREVDLLEEAAPEVEGALRRVDEDSAVVALRPFQVVTLRLTQGTAHR